VSGSSYVTGDKGLLALKRHGVTRIVTPAAMLEWLKTLDTPVTETPEGREPGEHCIMSRSGVSHPFTPGKSGSKSQM
jgi:hypothetical protein